MAGLHKEINRFAVSNVQEMLGIYIAPDGSTIRQGTKIYDLAVQWADAMRTVKISCSDAWVTVTSTIWRTLAYPLSAINLKKTAM
jgi:hypothetical protein